MYSPLATRKSQTDEFNINQTREGLCILHWLPESLKLMSSTSIKLGRGYVFSIGYLKVSN